MSVARKLSLVGLGVALLAGGRLLTLPASTPAPARSGGAAATATLTGRWPAARVVDLPDRLADGRAYVPRFPIDAAASVGTALSADGANVRLLVLGADGGTHELMRHPAADGPQFNAFVAAGDSVFWMAATGAADAKSTLYRADWRRGTPAEVLVADPGDVVFFNSQYDLVVAGDRVYWASMRADGLTSELRSVPVRGGPVAVRPLDGAYALSAWPWVTSAGSSQSGPVELRNLTTGERRPVPAGQSELVTCGPAWCRVLVLGAAGQPARTDLMRPDGSGRVRMAVGGTTSAVLDVALLDRFEVLSVSGTAGADRLGGLTVLLYDLTAAGAVVLATDVATVQARGAFVWWSTGDNETTRWHVLDLRSLT